MNRLYAACLLPAILAAIAPRLADADALSSTERRIVAAVDRIAPRSLLLLQHAVDVNSGTLNLAGVRETGRLFQSEFETLGFATRWVDGAAWNRAGHLMARREGRAGALRVLLIGHLDTVFEKDSPFQRFERLDDSTARGPGIIDMKGGNVVMLLALRALAEAGVLDRLSVTAVLSGDEEKPGMPLALARVELLAAADWAELAIGLEDGDGDPRTAVIGRRGATGWVLRTSGLPAHSSQIFREDIGSGAVYEVARVLAAFHDSLSREAYLTVNPGVIVGGTRITLAADSSRGTAFGKSNVIAESSAVAGDLRTLSLEQRARVKATMARIAGASPPHAGAAITFEDGYPPFAPSEGNRRLLARYDQVSRDLGFGPVTASDPTRVGAADVAFTEGLVDMALDGVGLKGEGGHTVHETADLRTLPIQAKRLGVLLARLARR